MHICEELSKNFPQSLEIDTKGILSVWVQP